MIYNIKQNDTLDDDMERTEIIPLSENVFLVHLILLFPVYVHQSFIIAYY